MSLCAKMRNRLAGASSLTLAAMIASTATVAHAQSSAPDMQAAQSTSPAGVTAGAAAPNSDQGEVIVQGYRAALASAIASKRMSNNIVDVIKADDMASFPDANLAESIQRIPGVSIQRDAGEGLGAEVGIRPDVAALDLREGLRAGEREPEGAEGHAVRDQWDRAR